MKKSDFSNDSRSAVTHILLNVIHGLLCTNPRVTDVLSFALFTAATLMPSTECEKQIVLKPGTDGIELEEGEEPAAEQESQGINMVFGRENVRAYLALDLVRFLPKVPNE